MSNNVEKGTDVNKKSTKQQQDSIALENPPSIHHLGLITKLTGKGRQYEDGRKYSERQ